MGARAWPLCLVCALGVAHVAPQGFPSCRKSPELHAVHLPASLGRHQGQNGSYLVLFGGKGFSWLHEAGRRGRREVKRHVQMFGMAHVWGLDVRSGRWLDIPALPAAGPLPRRRWKSGVAEIGGGTELALFGGCWSTSPKGVLNDLWVYTPSCCPVGGRWRRVATMNPPRPRRGHVVAANSTHLVVWGGKSYEHGRGVVILNDLWALPLAALRPGGGPGRWTRGAAFPGARRWGATGTVLEDGHGGEVLATFGGRVLLPNGTYRYFDHLWFYDFARDAWQEAPRPPGAPAPRPRDHHGAAKVNGELFVFGGRDAPTRSWRSALNDVWSFSPATGRWTEHHPGGDGGVPRRRYMPGVAAAHWHGGEEVLAVVGGEILPGSTKESSLNDAWVYFPRPPGRWLEVSQARCDAEATGVLLGHNSHGADGGAFAAGGTGPPARGLWYAVILGPGVVLVAGAVAAARSRRAQHSAQASAYRAMD